MKFHRDSRVTKIIIIKILEMKDREAPPAAGEPRAGVCVCVRDFGGDGICRKSGRKRSFN